MTTPAGTPEDPTGPLVVPVDVAETVARKFLAEADAINIHNHHALIASHAALRESLRSLLSALDTEGDR